MAQNSQLLKIADAQQGFFTAQQASGAGIARSNHYRMVRSSQWIRVGRGIYRLAAYPTVDYPDLVIYSLWSRNKHGEPQGVWSHDTALNFYDVCDINPGKLHMTVPSGFRRMTPIPKVLQLHYGMLGDSDYRQHAGYRVTTPIRTLNDVVEEGVVLDNIIMQALRESLRRGIVTRRQIETQASPRLLEYYRRLDG
jgi:predicted transcriptional regulator of viral defense system